jgi:hypothetical protein
VCLISEVQKRSQPRCCPASSSHCELFIKARQQHATSDSLHQRLAHRTVRFRAWIETLISFSQIEIRQRSSDSLSKTLPVTRNCQDSSECFFSFAVVHDRSWQAICIGSASRRCHGEFAEPPTAAVERSHCRCSHCDFYMHGLWCRSASSLTVCKTSLANHNVAVGRMWLRQLG